MSLLKDSLLESYYLATLPARRRSAVRRAACETEPVRVMFYHRVADSWPNDWTISSRKFAEQVNWLRIRFDIVTLAEAQARIVAGRNRIPTACITFDDGYAENMQFAVPMLVERRIPFTNFVSTNYVLNGRPFPHDVAAGTPLPPNSLADLRRMAEEGVEIGAHTCSHIDLGAPLSIAQLDKEIAGCKHELEQAIGREVRYFAFPYGLPQNLSPAAFRVAYRAGFRGVCSAYGGYNFPGDDPFHIRRFHADAQMIRFKNWLTVDPRKLRSPLVFDPANYRDEDAAGRRTVD
jgi:peptidoglycan/xylan/chitin deacetylase (PgdA/CDA1 family)